MIIPTMLRPYWIEVEGALGVGVTARSEADALTLVEGAFGPNCDVIDVRPIRDMRELDQTHVAPNMGNWFKRGV